MHLSDIVQRRRLAGTDSPHRLVGDCQTLALSVGVNAVLQLTGNDVYCPAGGTLALGLANTDNGMQRRAASSLGFCGDNCTVFAMELSPLRMAENHRGGSGIAQHLRRDVAGERTRSLPVAILAADGNSRSLGRLHCFRDQCRGRADENMSRCRFIRQGPAKSPNLSERSPYTVHFPVARKQHTRV